jgi:hypothetical protein
LSSTSSSFRLTSISTILFYYKEFVKALLNSEFFNLIMTVTWIGFIVLALMALLIGLVGVRYG